MVDPRTLRRWIYRTIFVAISILAVFFYVLPLHVGSGRWPGPDLILIASFTWVLRRPEYVPVFLLAAIMLTADFVFQRPPGLWAGLSIGATEFLRRREATSRDMPFLIEWAMVAGVLGIMTFAYRLVLMVFFVEQSSFGLEILAQISTILAYPAMVLVTALGLGVTKITASEADEMRLSG